MNVRFGKIIALPEVDVAHGESSSSKQTDAGVANPQSISAGELENNKSRNLNAANAIFGLASKDKKLSKKTARKLQPKVFNNPYDWSEYMDVDKYMDSLNFKEPLPDSTGESTEEISLPESEEWTNTMDGSRVIVNSSTAWKSGKEA